VSITALTQEVDFSQDAGALKKMSESTHFFSFHKFTRKSAPTLKRRYSL